MNKQNLWFLTLFSLILILGVYYITMPNSLLEKVAEETNKINTSKQKVINEVKEESPLVAMRVNLQEERQEKMDGLQEKLTKDTLSNEEKNNVYEELKYLNEVQGTEEKIEKKIKKEYKLDCFIKIENNNVNAVCVSDKHDSTIANNIMRLIQKEYDNKLDITVKFQKK